MKMRPETNCIVEERGRLRDEFGALYDTLNAILFRHDPIKINFGPNTDEYDPEVRTILPRLKDCSSPLDVREVVHQEFVRWFGPDIAGQEAHFTRVAEEVWRVWQE